MEVDRCTELEPLLVDFASGRAGTLAAQRVEHHLGGGCAHCAGRLERLQVAWLVIAETLPVSPPPDGARETLIAAARSTSQERPEVPIVYREGNPLPLLRTLVGLFAVAVLAAAFWGHGVRGEARDAAAREGATRARIDRVVADYRSLGEARDGLAMVLEAVTRPGVRIADLTDGTSRIRVFIEPAGQLTVTASGLPSPPEGRLYALWAGPRLLGPLPPDLGNGGAARLEGGEHVDGDKLFVSVEDFRAGPPTAPGLPVFSAGP